MPLPQAAGVAVTAPPDFFKSAPFPEQLHEAAVVVKVFNDTGLISGMGTHNTEVFAAVAIDFRSVYKTDYGKLNITGLATPVELALPAPFKRGMKCAFWDEALARWSTQGVETSSTNVLGGNIRCLSSHFSLFGAIIESIVMTLKCANFDLFSSESVSNVFKGTWYQEKGAIICEVLLLLYAAFMGAAAVLDRRRKRGMAWNDAFFLIETPSEEAPVDYTQSYVSADERAAAEAAAAEEPGFLAKAAACCSCSDGIYEAVDDICSSWFECFGQVRTCLQQGAGLFSGSRSNNGPWTLQVAAHLALSTHQRVVAASMGLSDDVMDLVLHDEDLRDFLASSKPIRPRNSPEPPRVYDASRDGEWRVARNQYDAWRMLHDEVSHRLATVHMQKMTLWRSVGAAFLARNPISDVLNFDVFQSCKQRVLLVGAEFWGAMALACVFYEASGAVNGVEKEGCDLEAENLEQAIGILIGRSIVIATASIFIGTLPNMFLQSLQTKGFVQLGAGYDGIRRKTLRKWVVQERMFWSFGTVYLLASIFYVAMFLANIGVKDHGDWSIMGALTVAEDFLLLPFFATASMPCLFKLFLYLHTLWTKSDEASFHRHVLMVLRKKKNMLLPNVSV